MESAANDRTYVSFKWLFVTSLSLMGIMMGFFYFFVARVETSLERKIDKEFFNERTIAITEKIGKLDNRLENIDISLDKVNELIKLHLIAQTADKRILDKILEKK